MGADDENWMPLPVENVEDLHGRRFIRGGPGAGAPYTNSSFLRPNPIGDDANFRDRFEPLVLREARHRSLVRPEWSMARRYAQHCGHLEILDGCRPGRSNQRNTLGPGAVGQSRLAENAQNTQRIRLFTSAATAATGP